MFKSCSNCVRDLQIIVQLNPQLEYSSIFSMFEVISLVWTSRRVNICSVWGYVIYIKSKDFVGLLLDEQAESNGFLLLFARSIKQQLAASRAKGAACPSVPLVSCWILCSCSLFHSTFVLIKMVRSKTVRFTDSGHGFLHFQSHPLTDRINSPGSCHENQGVRYMGADWRPCPSGCEQVGWYKDLGIGDLQTRYFSTVCCQISWWNKSRWSFLLLHASWKRRLWFLWVNVPWRSLEELFSML